MGNSKPYGENGSNLNNMLKFSFYSNKIDISLDIKFACLHLEKCVRTICQDKT